MTNFNRSGNVNSLDSIIIGCVCVCLRRGEERRNKDVTIKHFWISLSLILFFRILLWEAHMAQIKWKGPRQDRSRNFRTNQLLDRFDGPF